MIDAICIDSGYVVDSVIIEDAKANTDNANNANNANNAIEDQQQKKIISLNRGALTAHNDDEDDADEDDDDNDSSSSEDQEQDPDQEQGQEQGQEQDQVQEHKDFELKIGYKPSATSNKTMQLNYGNMSVSALRQLAKERGLGGDDGDLQKLKKKDLVQILQ
jgi:cobalamin biosynthesis protein CobT